MDTYGWFMLLYGRNQHNIVVCTELDTTGVKWLSKNTPYDPSNPLLGIYPEKTLIQKDTCTPTFIAALFTRAKTRKQPKCPSTHEWKKMWYTYTTEYYSAIREWNIMRPFISNMDGPRDYHTKWGKSDKDKHHRISLICGIKLCYKWTYLQKRNTHRHKKQTYGYQRGKGVEKGLIERLG